jgi:hypothetical protein
MELFFHLVQHFVFFPLHNIKLLNDTFCHHTDYMEETASLVHFSQKAGKEVGQLIDHCVIACGIVVYDAQHLGQSGDYIYPQTIACSLTLSDMPNSSRIWAKVATLHNIQQHANWDLVDFKVDSDCHEGFVVGEVHASVVKLKAPLCSQR